MIGLALNIGFGKILAFHSTDGGGYIVRGKVVVAVVPFLGEAEEGEIPYLPDVVGNKNSGQGTPDHNWVCSLGPLP